MTAIRFADAGVAARHADCGQQRWASRMDLGEVPVSEVRKKLARRGWQVGVRNIEYEDDKEIRRGPRLDYCPEHRTDGKKPPLALRLLSAVARS